MRLSPVIRNGASCCTPAGPTKPRLAAALVRAALILALSGLALLAGGARADDLVLEASFLSDPVPAEGTDLNLSLGLSPGASEEAQAQPRLQLATRLAPGLGLAVDGGLALGPDGAVAPGPASASLKLALADPGGWAGGAGVHASADLQVDPLDRPASEAGLGLGLSRAAGPLTLRGAVWAMSTLGHWAPHGHAGLSAALGIGPRVRALLEVVADLRGAGSSLGAGPTLKVELAEGTTLALGALVGVAPWAGVTSVVVQVGRAL